jgi:hypothetical protein
MTVQAEQTVSGKKVTITEPATELDIANAMREKPRILWIRAFGGRAIPPLAGLEDVVDLAVLQQNVASDAAVAGLPQLRALTLETYAQDLIDFASFGSLDRLHLNRRPTGDTAVRSRSIRSLSMDGHPGVDLEWTRPARLVALRVANARTLQSLDGLESQHALQKLWLIGNRQLRDLSALKSASLDLVELVLSGCGAVSDIEAIASQRSLKRLHILECGLIRSLKPLEGHPELVEVIFYGTKIEDGDISHLLTMPRLRRVVFANRRHYSHDLAAIEAAVSKGDAAIETGPTQWWS